MTVTNELILILHLLAAGAALTVAARAGRDWVTAFIVVCTIFMNVEVNKTFEVFGLSVTGGNVAFAAVFLASNVLNEHFGPAAARRAVLISFGGSLLLLLLSQFAIWYQPDAADLAQPQLLYFFGVQAYPRIVTASMASYLLSQLLDVWLYGKIRRATRADRLLWLRSNGSTWASQAFDTVFFTTAALTGFGGPLHSFAAWRDAIVFAYLVKVAVAAADTPFLYLTTWRPLLPPGSRRESRP